MLVPNYSPQQEPDGQHDEQSETLHEFAELSLTLAENAESCFDVFTDPHFSHLTLSPL